MVYGSRERVDRIRVGGRRRKNRRRDPGDGKRGWKDGMGRGNGRGKMDGVEADVAR